MDLRWKYFIDDEMKKEYMIKLRDYITERRKVANVIPLPNQIFHAFSVCDFSMLKVVILGQDPYPSRSDAHGLAFSSLASNVPLSLKNIFDEIYQDFYQGNTGGVHPFKHNNLTQWSEQGVLLLNSCLTTEEGKSGEHQNKGWEIFTENIIKYISEKHDRKIVFMLWGKQARSFKKFIGERHLVLECEHPAAAKHNQNSWFGNKHFTTANNFIVKHYRGIVAPITWGIF